MIVLGFLLLVACAVVVVAVIYGGQKPAQFDFGLFDIDVQSSAFFFSGMIVSLVLVFGLWLMKRGLRKSREQRKELRNMEKMRGELDRMSKVQAEEAKHVDKSPQEPPA